MGMNRSILFSLSLIIGILIANGFVEAEDSPPAKGGVMPRINFDIPQSLEHQEYLQVGSKKTFTIADIKADVVLIQIFSMY
jgi:hypothetical protein